jgi:hypothetical protein
MYSCSSYKEVNITNKDVTKTNTIYLYFNKQYYQLTKVQNFSTYYLADAIIIDKPTQEKNNIIIYTNEMIILKTNQKISSIRINKDQIIKYAKITNNKGKVLTIIGLTAIAIVIISVIIEHEENKLKIHPHE